ncbi:MAG TPA: D-alanine--D-alanine ligase [Candidatus Paceibacterota bacterium]|nr:D-alanine--D-alanine ligase [Candidatus Paceibacterota bacterium]
MRMVVGVLRGGPSSEYDVSLKSGAAVLGALDTGKYEPRDIFIDRQGAWHAHGVAMPPERALRGVDVALNAMHGEYGEDGEVQKLLDALAVPYTGSGAAASALAFNKARTKQAVKKFDIKTPRALLVSRDDAHGDLEALSFTIFRSFPHPAIVKPAIGGSSVGTTIVNSYHALQGALEAAFAISEQALVEEFIRGREATVGVVDDFRGEKTYALFPVEIIPPRSRPFFDYHAKYSGESVERVPGNFTSHEKDELARLAKAVHEGLGLSHYSRSDFILSRRGIYFLEVNTLPGLTSESLLPKAVSAVGSSLPQFLDHIISLAKSGRGKLLSVSYE